HTTPKPTPTQPTSVSRPDRVNDNVASHHFSEAQQPPHTRKHTQTICQQTRALTTCFMPRSTNIKHSQHPRHAQSERRTRHFNERSEERRVGKERQKTRTTNHHKKKGSTHNIQ